MDEIRGQNSIGVFALRVTLCCTRSIGNRIFQITFICSLFLICWIITQIPHLFIDGPHTLCVAVLSAPNRASAERREAARETWLSLEDGVKHYFFVGDENLSLETLTDLMKESRKKKDVVLLPMVDNYKNLTLKLLHSIRYIVRRCNCKYILKADDDSFARVDLIVSELEVVKVEQLLYWGYFSGKAPVFRKGTWAEPDWFLCDKYLPYARGGGYVFSERVAEHIHDSWSILQRYASEDVSFGAWTAGLQLHRVHDPRFDTEYQSRGCLNSYIVTHKQSISQMREKMRNFRATGRICTQEEELRKPYTYNWTVLPSQCCDKS